MDILRIKEILLKGDIDLSDFGLVIRRDTDWRLNCSEIKIDDVSGVYLIGFTKLVDSDKDIPVYVEDSVKEKIYNISYSLMNEKGTLRMKFDSPIAISLRNGKSLGFKVRQLYGLTGDTLVYSSFIIKETQNTKIIYEENK